MNEKKRLLYLSQWFDPEFTFKGLSFVQKLSEEYDVEVLTGFPNYPHGRLFEGYKLNLYQFELLSYTPVHRVFLYPSHNSNPYARSLNYISFFISCFFFLLFNARRFDIVYVYHPPILPALAASLFKSLHKYKLVVDIQDLWPDTLLATGMFSKGFFFNIISFICGSVYRASDLLFVLSNGFKSELFSRGVPVHKIYVVYNWCNEKFVNHPFDTSTILPSTGFNIVYLGNMGPAQDLFSAVDALRYLPTDSSVNLILVGTGLHFRQLEILSFSNHRLVVFPSVSPYAAYLLMRESDACLVHLKSDPLFSITIPSKTQAYLFSGAPIVMSCEGEALDIVKHFEVGMVSKPGDPKALAAVFQQISNLPIEQLEKFRSNALSLYHSRMSFERGTYSICSLLSQLS